MAWREPTEGAALKPLKGVWADGDEEVMEVPAGDRAGALKGLKPWGAVGEQGSS
jgi:hypothetical protein